MLKRFTLFFFIASLFSPMMALESQISPIIEEEDEFLACVESNELYTDENEREFVAAIEKTLLEEQIRFASASYLQYKYPAECTPAMSDYLTAMRNVFLNAHLEEVRAHNMVEEFPQSFTFEDAVFSIVHFLKIKAIDADTLRKIENKYLDTQAHERINRYYEMGKRSCVVTMYNLSLVARVTN